MIFAPIDLNFRDCSVGVLIGAVRVRVGYDETQQMIAESGGSFKIDYPVNWSLIRLYWSGWIAGDL